MTYIFSIFCFCACLRSVYRCREVTDAINGLSTVYGTKQAEYKEVLDMDDMTKIVIDDGWFFKQVSKLKVYYYV